MKHYLIKKVKDSKNIRHPLCKGDGIDHCGYYTTIDCSDCKYGGGRKNPEAKSNQNEKD